MVFPFKNGKKSWQTTQKSAVLQGEATFNRICSVVINNDGELTGKHAKNVVIKYESPHVGVFGSSYSPK